MRFAILLALLRLAHLSGVAAETHVGYKTEPDFWPEVFTTEHITPDRGRLAPGYLFVDTFVSGHGMGPSIYTNEGELVWYGNASASWRVQDFHACDFLGQRGTHLCWHEAEHRRGHTPVGRKVIFDGSYRLVGHNYTWAGEGTFPNTHEFRMTPGGHSFLQPAYPTRNMDLRPFKGPEDGWVFDGCLMEIDTATGNDIFKWCALDYMPVWQTGVFINSTDQYNESSNGVGKGTYNKPWDFFHMNAIDKNFEGDYLISSRYLDQIIKIAGPENPHGLKPGTIIWRLGGTDNDFQKDFVFSKQHSVRYIETRSSETFLSIFSNHWDGHTTPTANFSEGMLIRINNSTDKMSAELIQRFPHPHLKISKAQGNMFVLPNGNTIVGWGTRRELTEFSPKGDILNHAALGRFTYRVAKSVWVGKPHWNPKLVGYMQSCSSSEVHAYVSWNGATEVTNWRFFVGPSAGGPWVPAGTFAKVGFETHATLWMRKFRRSRFLSSSPRFVSVEALDSNREVIGSAISETFVPSEETIREHKCDAMECHEPVGYHYDSYDSCSKGCKIAWIPGAAGIIILVLAIETLEMVYRLAYKSKRRISHESEKFTGKPVWLDSA